MSLVSVTFLASVSTYELQLPMLMLIWRFWIGPFVETRLREREGGGGFSKFQLLT